MIKKHIPNTITCLNLACGCTSVYFAGEGSLAWAGLMIFAAAVFDFIDGFAARLLHVKSELGKQLDSLADVVSFGVAPGLIMFRLLVMGNAAWEMTIPEYVFTLALLIPVASALRLAKFNIDARQGDSFLGLPTPAAGLMMASYGLMVSGFFESPWIPVNENILLVLQHPVLLIGTILILAFLMISEIPLIALKFKNRNWHDNNYRYIFIILSFLLLLLFFFAAIPLIVLVYILISIIALMFKTDKNT